MKTPKKPSLTGRLKKYTLMVVSLGESQEIAEFASPDVNVAIVNLPVPEKAPLSRHFLLKGSSDLLELVKGSAGFSGILLDSFLEIGLDVARESLEIPITGLFWASVSQALLVASTFVVVYVVAKHKDTSNYHKIIVEELCQKYHVTEKCKGVGVFYNAENMAEISQVAYCCLIFGSSPEDMLFGVFLFFSFFFVAC